MPEYNLSRDIQEALDHVGEVSPREQLLARFRPRPSRPREYARKHAVGRKVENRLVGPDDPLPQSPSPGWDLLVLQGYAFSLQDLERLCRRMEGLEGRPALLVGLPRSPLPISEELRELSALDWLAEQTPYNESPVAAQALVEQRAFLERRIREQIQVSMRPRAFRWRHLSAPLEWTPPDQRQAFLVQALEMVYPDTPLARPRASKTAMVQALQEVLDVGRPMFLCRAVPCPSSSVLERVLMEPGIVVLDGEHGSYARLRVTEWITYEEDTPDQRLWRELLDQLFGDRENERRQTLGELLAWMAEPPRGVRGPLAQLYLGAALRARLDDVELRQADRAYALSGATLSEALADPASWELRYRVAGRHEEAFLKSMRGMFGTGNLAILMEGDLWERTFRQVEAWYRNLPALTRCSQQRHSPEAQALLDLVGEKARRTPVRELLSRDLPAVLGLSGIPPVEEQSIFLERLDSTLQELEDHLSSRYRELAVQIQRLITGQARDGVSAMQWLDTGCREWLGTLHPGTESRPVSPWADALRRTMMVGTGAVELRWFTELPQAMEMPRVADWDVDRTRLFLARVAQGRIELELWRVQEVLAPGQEPGKLKEQVREWIHQSMDAAGLPVGEREAVLLDLLDELVWV